MFMPAIAETTEVKAFQVSNELEKKGFRRKRSG